MKRFFLFTLLFISVCAKGFSQNIFEKTYPVTINNEFTYFSRLLVLSDSSYMFATTAYDNSNNSILFGRIGYDGNTIWVKQIDDSYQISETDIALSSNNFLYLTYSAQNDSSFRYSSVLLKLDLNGNLIWSKSYGDSTHDQRCRRIFLTTTSIYLSGQICSGADCDLYILKLDTMGNFAWGKYYDAAATDYLRDAKQLSNHDILLSGLTQVSPTHYFTSIFRVDTNGAVVWQKRFRLPSFKEFNSQAINEDYDGTLLIAGHADSVDVSSPTYFGLWDMSVMKLSATGNFLWGKIYGGSDYDELWEILPTNDHGFICAAEPESFGNVSRISLMKIDSAGNFGWMKLYGESTGGFPNKIVINKDHGYTIFAADGDYSVVAPMVLIRTDSLGGTICLPSSVTLSQESFTPLTNSNETSGSITGTASFAPVISTYPLLSTNYCNADLIANLAGQGFVEISPNPTTTSIQLHLPSNHSTTLTLFNLLGEKVKEQTITNSDITIDVGELPAAMYVVRVGEWSGKFVKE